MIVADTSAIVAALAVDPIPVGLTGRLTGEDELHVPHLADLEFLSAIRRLLFTGSVTEERATIARRNLGLLSLVRYSHEPFTERIWALRQNLTSYDAVYVALAEALDATIVSCDRKLAQSTGHQARVELFG